MVRVHLIGADVRTIECDEESMVDEVMGERKHARWAIFEMRDGLELRDLSKAVWMQAWWNLPPSECIGDDLDVAIMRVMLRD